MSLATSPELYWLTAVALFTALLWLPYILQLIVQLGPVAAVWDPTGAHPHDADWALRAKRAHYNAVENLVIFAPMAILVVVTGVGDALTAGAAMVYFFARVAHYLIYIAALPVVRTIAFAIGAVCQLILALRLFEVI